MTESTLPRWALRLNATREHGFDDLIPIVAAHYRAHEDAEKFLGPYNARQRSSKFPYLAPTREALREAIPQRRMNEFSYFAMLNSLVRFCEVTKGTRGLPTPHPSTIHSIQLPKPAFRLSADSKGGTMIEVIGAEREIRVSGLRTMEIPFIIVRPRLSRLGTASGTDWEVLFFREAHGYIPEWSDSDMNPRYSGRLC